MSVSLELKKVKRTGFIPTFLAGGILAAAIPIMNMAFRSESFLNLSGTPLQILFNANWQMMATLNVLLIFAGACLMYHIEYTDNAMQRMETLPMRQSSMFFGKVVMLSAVFLIVLAIEAASLTISSFHWFSLYSGFWSELGKNFGYLFLLSFPCIILSLLISLACRNMWVSLGIGVVCIFIATMMPANFILSLFPFAMPFQIFGGTDTSRVLQFVCAAIIEIFILGTAELLFIKVRRLFE